MQLVGYLNVSYFCLSARLPMKRPLAEWTVIQQPRFVNPGKVFKSSHYSKSNFDDIRRITANSFTVFTRDLIDYFHFIRELF